MTDTTASTRITTPFGFTSTAAEVVEGVDLSGRRAIVTGASSGIGIETALALASAGAEITLAVRDRSAGERVAAEIVAATGASVRVGRLDLADLASVAAFAAAWDGPLHVLVNNAGVMHLPELQLSPQGVEQQLATNHLGHLALALGLHDALAAEGARIVSLSSVAHLASPVLLDDLDFHRRPYEPAVAYGQSKTANALFAVEATHRWSGEGITANAVHPGAIIDTNLTRHMDQAVLARLVESGSYTFKTREQGAATSVLAATWPGLEGIGGRYLEDCNEAVPVDPDDRAAGRFGVAPYALDPEAAARLWEVSLELLDS